MHAYSTTTAEREITRFGQPMTVIAFMLMPVHIASVLQVCLLPTFTTPIVSPPITPNAGSSCAFCIHECSSG